MKIDVRKNGRVKFSVRNRVSVRGRGRGRRGGVAVRIWVS